MHGGRSPSSSGSIKTPLSVGSDCRRRFWRRGRRSSEKRGDPFRNGSLMGRRKPPADPLTADLCEVWLSRDVASTAPDAQEVLMGSICIGPGGGPSWLYSRLVIPLRRRISICPGKTREPFLLFNLLIIMIFLYSPWSEIRMSNGRRALEEKVFYQDLFDPYRLIFRKN